MCNIPLVAFDDTVHRLVERSRREVAAPVMVVTVGVREEVTGQDGVPSRNVMSNIGQLTSSSGSLSQSTEIVGKCSKADLQQCTTESDDTLLFLFIFTFI